MESGQHKMSYRQSSSKAILHPELTILPWPANIKHNEGYFQIAPDMVILTDNETQTVGALLAETLAPGLSPLVLVGTASALPAISLGLDPELTHLGREGYTLKVTPQQVTIRSASLAGVFYGTQTLS